MVDPTITPSVALDGVALADEYVPYSVARRRFDVGLILAAAWCGLVLLAALLADLLPLVEPTAIDAAARRQGPSSVHWLGADQLGRDLLSRLVFGARTSLVVGVLATALSGTAGALIGLFAGYFRRGIETVTMGAMDILLSFPALVLAIALTAMTEPGVGIVIIAIAILALPSFARIARAQTLTYTERVFVTAARSLGARHSRILFREIGPNMLPTVLAFAFVIVAVAIVIEGSLSFLGLGVPPNIPTWGGMISYGRSELERAPHIGLLPAGVMFLTVLALNNLGDKLRRREAGAATEL